MEMDRMVPSRIKEALKANPRGMNVTEVAGEIKMNRQTVAKYLEMLVISGHVDVRSFGPSKVYYLSQRMPVSAMLSLSYDFIILLDKQLKVLNANDRFLEFSGILRDDILYKSIDHLAFPIQFEPTIMPNIKEALQGIESSAEAYYKKRGKESFYNVKFIPMVLDDGEKGVTVIFENITARKQMEEELRNARDELEARVQERTRELESANKALKAEIEKRKCSEEALQKSQQIISTIVGTLPGIVYKSDAQKGWALEFISDGCRELTGFEPSELLGKSYDSSAPLIHPEDVCIVKNSVKEALDARRPFRIKYRIIKANGERRWVLEQGRGVYDPYGKLTHVDGFISDITETMAMEEALRKSEEKFRAFVENVSDGAWETDKDIKFTYVSPSICEVMGCGPEQILGKTPYDLMPPDEVERVMVIMQPVVVLRKPFSLVEFDTLSSDGRRVAIEVSGDPIIDEHGKFKGFRGIVRDVSARKMKK